MVEQKKRNKIINDTIDAIEKIILEDECSSNEMKKNATRIKDELSREKLDNDLEHSTEECAELVKKLEALRNHENFGEFVDQIREFCDKPPNEEFMIEPEKPWPRG